MKNIIIVAIGGASGSIIRYFLSLYINQLIDQQFPYATLVVNILGCFLIGLLSTLIVIKFQNYTDVLNNLLLIGFLGGLTTFSTFSNETFLLLQRDEVVMALLYIGTSIIIGLSAVWLGMHA